MVHPVDYMLENQTGRYHKRRGPIVREYKREKNENKTFGRERHPFLFVRLIWLYDWSFNNIKKLSSWCLQITSVKVRNNLPPLTKPSPSVLLPRPSCITRVTPLPRSTTCVRKWNNPCKRSPRKLRNKCMPKEGVRLGPWGIRPGACSRIWRHGSSQGSDFLKIDKNSDLDYENEDRIVLAKKACESYYRRWLAYCYLCGFFNFNTEFQY